MFLNRLCLSDYRNIGHIELDMDPNVNIFVGLNAQGKTNLLESIFVLALTKSHRTYQDKQLIRWDATQALLHCEVEKKYGSCTLDLALSAQGKKAKVNGLEQKKLSEYIGHMNVVMFAPEDLDIVKGAPGIRRRFLDMEIGQVFPAYLHDLSQFQKILNQKNNLLKQFHQNNANLQAMLDIWNEQFVQASIKIMDKRQNFVKKLQAWANRIHSGITRNSEQIEITYDPSFEYNAQQDETVLFDQYMIKLTQAKEKEMKRGVSLIGPHRDDLSFRINGKEVQYYGSQGQQRTAALSLKLAEIECIREEVGEYPILLLDDVLSELDQHRQTQLIATFQNKVQTFITTTSLESVNLHQLDRTSIFEVNNGNVGRGQLQTEA